MVQTILLAKQKYSILWPVFHSWERVLLNHSSSSSAAGVVAQGTCLWCWIERTLFMYLFIGLLDFEIWVTVHVLSFPWQFRTNLLLGHHFTFNSPLAACYFFFLLFHHRNILTRFLSLFAYTNCLNSFRNELIKSEPYNILPYALNKCILKVHWMDWGINA